MQPGAGRAPLFSVLGYCAAGLADIVLVARYTSAVIRISIPVLFLAATVPALAQLSPETPDLLCKVREVAAGSFSDGTLRKLESRGVKELSIRFYNIDLKAGTAKRRVGDGRSPDSEIRVGVEPNALVFLFENYGYTKTMATVLMEKREEGFPIVSTQQGWWRNDLTLGVDVGTCVASRKL